MRLQFRQCEQGFRSFFVTNAEHVFTSMAERPVPDVVQDECCSHQAPLVCGLRVVYEKFTTLATYLIEGARAHCKRSEGMREARVFRRRKSQVGQTELPQAPQTLEHRAVQQTRLGGGELDKVMHRVVDALHGGLLASAPK